MKIGLVRETAPREIRRLQRWVNNKFIFRVCERFEDYEKGLKEGWGK